MPSASQLRASAIIAFRQELSRLEREGVLALDPDARARLHAHHEAELTRLAAEGELDLSEAAARLSMGMRIATLLGTIALSAAYALFVSAHWGRLAFPLQLALVSVPALLLVLLTHLMAMRERSGYVASLLATVAVIAFVSNLSTLGTLFNLPDSRTLFLAAGTLAMLLAYGYGLTLPLLLGIVGLGAWAWSLAAIPLGLWWRDAFGIAEPLLAVSAIALVIPAVVRRPAHFAGWWRGIGATLLVLALLMLEQNGRMSVFSSVDIHIIELGYKILGAIVLTGLIAWGLRRDQRVVMVVGTTGAVLFLFLRLVDWFWALVPQWLFFLLVGAFAIGVLLVLKRLRRVRVEAA